MEKIRDVTKQNVFDVLKRRGYIKQTVYGEDLYTLLGTKGVSFYAGFDPTADSLHVGHYIPIMAMSHLQRAGHKPIILIGGGTAMIGDPSFKNDMRKMMTKEVIAKNAEGIKKQASRFLSFTGENAAVIVNNADWLLNLNYVDFLRDIGVHFSVNKMLTADCFKARLEKGLSFFEFNYMLMQGYDFLELYRRYGCALQIGGNDQWSNILAGADLIRRKEGKDAFALTVGLLLNSDGSKMGKTSKGALWLDAEKTTPYEFYQYFRNVEDAKVKECLYLLTFTEENEIEELTQYADERINGAKKRLAFEVTKLVHGEAAAVKARDGAEAAFGGGAGDMPTVKAALGGGATVADLLVALKLSPSKSDARRLIEGKGVKIDGKTVENAGGKISDFTSEKRFVLEKGKKVKMSVEA